MGNETLIAVRRQIAAMGVPVFEVGVFTPASPARDACMLLRTWDAETLERSVPWLRAKNAGGAAIYIRPHGEHPLSLVDDLKPEVIPEMKKAGFEPALVVQTSPGNVQAWLNHGRTLPKAVSTAAARVVAERWGGDKGAADWRHFGRLCGFTNKKRKYEMENGLYPFVRVLEAGGSVYSCACTLIPEIENQVATEGRARTAFRSASFGEYRNHGNRTIDDFRANSAYKGDGNRIDLAYAVYALSHGVPEATVRDAIASRDLSKKGNAARQLDYIDRTIQKARRGLADRSGVPERA